MCFEARTAGIRTIIDGYVGSVRGPRPSWAMSGMVVVVVPPDGGGGMPKRESGWEFMMSHWTGGERRRREAKRSFGPVSPRE